MLHITCPSCDTGLEVDPGFRGGVCRCSQCGTLLTVPDEKGPQIVESLGRPDVPEGTPLSPNTFQTASGRKLTLTKHQLSEIPTAKKHRPAVRRATMGAILLLMAGIIFGFLQLTSTMFAPPPSVDVASIYKDVFQITDNPYLAQSPSFMGLPIAPRTIFMVDSSATMRNFLPLLKPAISHAFQTLDTNEAQLIVWNETAPAVFPEYPQATSKMDGDQLRATLDNLAASGGVWPIPSIERALQSKPNLIILVARQLPDDHSLAAETLELFQQAEAPITTILIDGTDKQLEALSQKTGGAYIELNSGQLQRWYQSFTSDN